MTNMDNDGVAMKSDDCSEPSVTIQHEHDDKVEIFLKIRGLEPKGSFSKFLIKLAKAIHPDSMMKNADINEWSLTESSVHIKMTVNPPSSPSHENKDNKSKKPAPTEMFEYGVAEFPCTITPEESRFDVREARNGSFLVMKFHKTDPRTNWSEFLRQNGTLDAKTLSLPCAS